MATKKSIKKKPKKANREGMIVHPNWTGSGGYNAHFAPNRNKNVKSFKKLSGAKNYLKRNGLATALYKNSFGEMKKVSTK